MSQPARFSFTSAIVLLGLTPSIEASPKALDIPRLPMVFEQNKGQAPHDAEFLSRGPGYTVLFGRDKVSIFTGKATVAMRILAASRLVRVEGTDEQQGKSNYFIGNDASKWLARVPNYSRVRYRGVYPGIDLVFYGNGKQLEYDWIVSAGADPNQIRTKFEGVRGMRVGPSGDLLLALKKDQIQWRRPTSYQGEGEKKVAVKADFIITKQREVGFSLGNYDRTRDLVIDPILSYATYIGSPGDDYVFSLAVDAQGNSYITGAAGAASFPIVAGAYQTMFKSSQWAGFVAKINPQGTALVYSTFLGGTGSNNSGNAIAVDSAGYAYVTGGTNSPTDFPLVNPIQNHNNGGYDIYLSKLSPNGDALIYSTYLGGTGDEFSQSIALDASNNVYMCGWTNSPTLFPGVPTPTPLRAWGGGVQDGFLTKVNAAGSAVVYSTYLGGSDSDNAFGVAVDSLNQAYVTGFTYSNNFPVKNAVQGSYHGNNDVFVSAVNAAGTDFVYSTYLGGDNQDRGRAIYVDSLGNAYVTGDTQSPSLVNGVVFPTTVDAYQPKRAGCVPGNCGGSADVFLTKLSPAGAMLYSTHFGGAIGYDCGSVPTFGCGAEKGLGITLDPMGNIFIGGSTNSTDFPTASPTQTHNAGDFDAFVIKFSADGHTLLFSTYFGGTGLDQAYNLARTAQGAIYVSGWASNSVNFPHAATPPLYNYGGGAHDGFVMKLSNADVYVVKHGFRSRTPSAQPSHQLQPKAVAGGNFSFSTDLQNSASSEDADNGLLKVTATGPTIVDSCTSSAGTCTVTNNAVTVNNIPTFLHGTTVNVTINGHLDSTAKNGDHVNFLMAGLSDTNDPDPSNNNASDGFTVGTTCEFFVTSNTTSFPAAGGSGNFSASSPCGFGWTLTNPVNWILAPNSGGSGGPFSFSVLANPTSAIRSATLTIGGQPLMITQQGATQKAMVVLYDKASGNEYTAVSNNDGTFTYAPNIFTAGFDILRSGDFNGDGKTDLVVYNSQTALAYIGFGNGDGTYAFQSLFWSPGYNIVESGDLNNDGKTDFALYNSSTGTMYTGISNGAGGFTYKYTLISIGFTFLRLADFTGDGKADLFVYNAATGSAFLGIGDGTGGFAFQGLFISPGYNFADVGDLNGDGKADLILYNSTNGNAATGISNGAGSFTFNPLVFSPGFTSVRLANYTGDNKADVTVYNKNNAAAYFGTGNGAGSFTFQSLFWSPGYDWVVPQDLNNDGKADIILYNSGTSTEYTGIGNGAGIFTYTYALWGFNKTLAR